MLQSEESLSRNGPFLGCAVPLPPSQLLQCLTLRCGGLSWPAVKPPHLCGTLSRMGERMGEQKREHLSKTPHPLVTQGLESRRGQGSTLRGTRIARSDSVGGNEVTSYKLLQGQRAAASPRRVPSLNPLPVMAQVFLGISVMPIAKDSYLSPTGEISSPARGKLRHGQVGLSLGCVTGHSCRTTSGTDLRGTG